jgi:transcriptional regulator with XRE-family HTH domain
MKTYHHFVILSIVLKSLFEVGENLYFRRLRDLREDNDLSQNQVADMLGIQQTVYSRYERGYQAIPLQHLITLADYYNVSIDYIVERTDNMTRS